MIKENRNYRLIKLKDFRFDVSTGKIMSYLYNLYQQYDINDLGFRLGSKNGIKRWEIWGLNPTDFTRQFFEDRCSAFVEREIMETTARESYNGLYTELEIVPKWARIESADKMYIRRFTR